MRTISIFVFLCLNYVALAQQISPISSTEKKINGLPNSQVNISNDRQLGKGSLSNNEDLLNTNTYSSTIIYVQNGQELIAYTLSPSDYHLLKVKLDELVALNQMLSAPDLLPNTKEQLERLRIDAQSTYDQLLVQAVANAK